MRPAFPESAAARLHRRRFQRIFAALRNGTCDAVISGTTITPERAAIARFSKLYLEFNQGVAVNRRLESNVDAAAGLRELTAGIQKGKTPNIVARQFLAQGHIAGSGTILMTVSDPRLTIWRLATSGWL